MKPIPTDVLAAAEKVCEAAHRKVAMKLSWRGWPGDCGYCYDGVEASELRDALTEWRRTKEGA